MKRWVRGLIMLTVLAGLGWYVWHARESLKIITQFDLRFLAPLLLVQLLAPWVNGRIGKELAAELGVRLGEFEAYALSTLNALGNYLPVPQAGAMARGVYLKRVHQLPYATYTASVVVTYVSALALYGLAGLAGLGALALLGQVAPWELWIVFAILSSSLVLFTPLARRIPLPGRLANFQSGLAALGRHHVLAKVIVLQLMMIGLTATGFWLACLALPGGGDVNWLGGLMIALLVMSSGIANVTPGNLGIEQAAAVFTAHLLKIKPEVGFLASSLFRVLAMAVVFVLGPMMAHWLSRQMPRNEQGFPVVQGGTIQ